VTHGNSQRIRGSGVGQLLAPFMSIYRFADEVLQKGCDRPVGPAKRQLKSLEICHAPIESQNATGGTEPISITHDEHSLVP
jgi:hypothetical protein